MEWKKYIIEVPEAEQVDIVYGALYEMGIHSIEIESLEFLALNEDEKDWDYCDEEVNSGNRIIFYLPMDYYGEPELMKSLKHYAFENGFKIQIKQEQVYEKQWTESWKKYFKPTKITDRIVIKPEWEIYNKENEEEIIIEIDPGMAFGTGTHETTAMCMELLESYIDEKTEVLDVGCGSGVLSIAAAKLGAQSVVGIDIDQTAVDISKENVEKNKLSDKIHIMQGDLTKNMDEKADIVVANIMAEIIVSLSKDIHNTLKGRKIFIVSGILIEKEDIVISALKSNGFNILKIIRKGDWIAAAAQYLG